MYGVPLGLPLLATIESVYGIPLAATATDDTHAYRLGK